MNDPQDPKIKVVDRRRFTEEGELRHDREPSPAPGPPPAPRSSPPPRLEDARPPGEPPTGGPRMAAAPLFLDLVNDLAQQAALLIEGTEGFPAQPAQARRVIDYLGMLRDKTAGNLSQQEQQVLGDVVYQLRTLYVKRVK